MELIHIDTPTCTALVSIQGAQLLAWKPKEASCSVVWCSNEHYWEPGKPIRGGVPICWPWFGKHNQPSHGFARLKDWQLVERQLVGGAEELVFELTDDDWTRSLWPWPFLVRLRMHLGQECQINFEVDCEVMGTGALHTYVQVGDIRHTRVKGLGCQYQDALQMLKPCNADEVLIVDQAVDRIYTSPAPMTKLDDSVLERQIYMGHRGHSDLVVWNPGKEGAVALGDIDAQQYTTFLCVETAAVNHSLESTLGLTLSVPSKMSLP